MKFFFDNDISFRIAGAIACLSEVEGDTVVHIKDKYGADAKDPAWLPALAEEGGWIIVTADTQFRRKAGEREVFRRARLTTFILAPGWLKKNLWDQAALLVRWWPAVRDQAQLAVPGAAYEIPQGRSLRFRPLP
ncbi:MAG: PIN-like domain-containing protein [Thermoanaerobaculia bacterium]